MSEFEAKKEEEKEAPPAASVENTEDADDEDDGPVVCGVLQDSHSSHLPASISFIPWLPLGAGGVDGHLYASGASGGSRSQDARGGRRSHLQTVLPIS